jgi:c-di-GMP-binding flagellar brake protein YcgR
MITSFIDRFRRKARTPSKADQSLNYTYLHLHQAQRNRDFLEVRVDDDLLYQSMILELDPQERTILIDELFPTGFVGLAGQKVQVAIRQSGGRKITFDSVILEQHHYDGTPIYVLAMPTDIETDQRRSAYRLAITNNAAIDSHFIGPDQQSYSGRLRNVSSTGIALEIMAAAEEANLFNYNDTLDHLKFDFAGINFDCDVAVRNVEVGDDDQDKVLIGAEFVDLPPIEKRVLERSIMRIQRDRIKYSGELETQHAMI